MSDLTLPYRRSEARPFSGLFAIRLHLNWEMAAYLALILIGGGFRFWDLGARALHHDESLHAYYSWNLYQNGVYNHLPLMHGPFQFFANAFIFLLFGASDYTSRILPAIFGTLLIGLPFFLRRQLGTAGALATAFFITVSPTMLYYSRFARNDIYIAAFTVGLMICIWRYVDERKPQYLVGMALLLALSFATQENTYIHVAILLLFLNFWLASDFWRQMKEETQLEGAPALSVFIVIALTAWAIVALWPFIRSLREGLGLRERGPVADLMLVLGTLTLPQLSAAVQIPMERLGWDASVMSRVVWTDFLGSGPVDVEQVVGVAMIATTTIAAAYIGFSWNWRVFALCAAAFYVPYILLFTTFFTNGDGFYSGNWGSLDYWILQQDVRRGTQPDFYYLVLLPAYELLPLLFAVPALLYYCLRGGLTSWLLTAGVALTLLLYFGGNSLSPALGEGNMGLLLPVVALALFGAIQGTMFERFLAFWLAASFFGYSAAGEKMPWVGVHLALAAILLGGYAAGKLWQRLGELDDVRGRLLDLRQPLLALIAGMGAMAFAAYGPDGDTWVAIRLLVLLTVVVSTTVFVAPSLARGRSSELAGQAVLTLAALACGALLIITVHASISAAYVNGDVPREMIIYTQTSPEVPDLMDRIERASQTSGQGRALPIVVDSTYSWPWTWYLRNYTNVQYVGISSTYQPPANAIVLLASSSADVMRSQLSQYDAPVPFALRWWFPEGQNIGGPGYRDIERDNIIKGIKDFGGDLLDGGTWQTWWRYIAYREPPGNPSDQYTGERARCKWCGSANAIAYFPLTYGTAATAGQPATDSSSTRTLVQAATFGQQGSAPGQFSHPAGVASDPAGNLYIADVGNNRIQKLSQDGTPIAQTAADLGLNQPHGVALDAQGNVYVADTWNHRILKLDSQLKLLASWGSAATSLDTNEPSQLWGPRDLTVDAKGNVWVADTGTARIQEFDSSGRVLLIFGRHGSGPGLFQEPSSIAIAPNGHIFVADYGNARIQRFSPQGTFLASYPMLAWNLRDPIARPYLRLLADGRIAATGVTQPQLAVLRDDGSIEAI